MFGDNFSVWDTADGNLTAASTFGAAAVDTSAPTPPTQPYTITYQATDAAGNMAAAKQRRVAVVCPAGEGICNSTSPLAAMSGYSTASKPYCSTRGMCLGPPPASAGVAVVVPQLPQLTLIGPAAVYVLVGQQYDACPPNPPADLLCDK